MTKVQMLVHLLSLSRVTPVSPDDISDGSPADRTGVSPLPEIQTTCIADTHVTTLVQHCVHIFLQADQTLVFIGWTGCEA